MTTPINLEGEKPDNISQEQWDRLKNVFDDIYEDESEVDEMPNKLTDAEVKKALECCVNKTDNFVIYHNAATREYDKITIKDILNLINRLEEEQECLKKEILNLDFLNKELEIDKKNLQADNGELQFKNSELEIELKVMRGAANSYKAEVERLKTNKETAEGYADALVKYTKAKAYKECIEKVKEHSNKMELVCSGALVKTNYTITDEDLDNLLNELVGDALIFLKKGGVIQNETNFNEK